VKYIITDWTVSHQGGQAVPKDTFKLIAPDKRERLLTEAAKLFAERGLSQTDMAEVALRAKVAKGSLYNYFKSKDDLYLHVCRDGLKRSRQAVYDGIDPDWDVYRQVEHIFRQGVRFTLANPHYVALYLNNASAGMERFAKVISRQVEKFTADHLKGAIRRGMEQGLVRPDLDVNLAAFLINSLYITLAISLVSPHFKIRLAEYLEIKGRLTAKAVEGQLASIIRLIHEVLGPPPA
jgi:TetR/AcrR family transcriptional regulator